MSKITLADGELRQYRFPSDTTPILVFPIACDADAFRAMLRELLAADDDTMSHAKFVLTKGEVAVIVTGPHGRFLIPWHDAARIAFATTDA
jgi:hypothetical protein